MLYGFPTAIPARGRVGPFYYVLACVRAAAFTATSHVAIRGPVKQRRRGIREMIALELIDQHA